MIGVAVDMVKNEIGHVREARHLAPNAIAQLIVEGMRVAAHEEAAALRAGIDPQSMIPSHETTERVAIEKATWHETTASEVTVVWMVGVDVHVHRYALL